jgi:hypothetical protein
MKSVSASVSITTVLFFVYTTLCLMPISLVFLDLFLLVLMVLLVWMVITILKYGVPSNHTFDEKFYEDQ